MAVFFNVLEQTKLRTEAWKQQRALKLVGAMTDLEGDVVLFRDLLRYAKLADVAYATDEERGITEVDPVFPVGSFEKGIATKM